MGKTFACYDVLQDGRTKMSKNDEGVEIKEFSWNPPNDIRLNQNSSAPFLSFRVHPYKNASNLKLRVFMSNGGGDFINISTMTLNGQDVRTVNEVLNQNNIDIHSNTFRFRIVSGDGQLILSDVYVAYKRVN